MAIFNKFTEQMSSKHMANYED